MSGSPTDAVLAKTSFAAGSKPSRRRAVEDMAVGVRRTGREKAAGEKAGEKAVAVGAVWRGVARVRVAAVSSAARGRRRRTGGEGGGGLIVVGRRMRLGGGHAQ